MADITTSSDPKTLQTQAEQLAPYMAQAFRQMTRDVATITKWNTGDFDYTQIYSMPVVYYDAASGKTLRIQVLMSAIVKALEDGAKEELTAIKASATEAAESAADSKEAAEAAKTQAEQSAATAAAQKDETISYLTTVKANEEARQNAELQRSNAESARVSAESTRQLIFEDSQQARKTAYENAEAERNVSYFQSEEERDNSFQAAEQQRAAAEQQRAAAESARVSAESTRQSQEAARQAQVAACKEATDLAEELNAHPQMQGSNGNWWKWNTETNEYEDTGIIARGGGMYPMVRTRRNHVIWYDSTDGFKERIVRRRNHTIIKL